MRALVTETSRRPRLLRLLRRPASEPAQGDGRIALALYEAQRAAAPAGTGPGPVPRTLEEIVAMAGVDARWSRAFRQLKAEGRLAEQTLGQVIAGRARRGAVEPPPTGALPAGPPAEPWRAPSRTAS
jgi:hypothetical protein